MTPEPLGSRVRSSRRAFLAGIGAGSAALMAGLAAPSPAAAAPPGLAGDGVTDDAPALQAHYDAGLQPAFRSGATYLLNSPVFLDKPDQYAMWVLELNGATLLLGPALPTTDSFKRDVTTRWAFFPNTSRSALSGTKVLTSVDSRATGDRGGALISLVVRNGTIDGAGKNAAFAFSNRTGVKFESVILRRGRALLSWRDYSDVNVFIQCHNRAGGPPESVLVDQVSSGDGLLMQACKSDASIGLARLKYCRGAEIVGTVTGSIELDSCSAIQIRGGHQETPIANETIISVSNSDVVIDTTAVYLSRGPAGSALPPAIRITDRGSIPSSVVLRDAIEMRPLLASDEVFGALISIDAPIAGTRVEARGLTSVVSASKVGGTWDRSIGPGIGGIEPVAAAVRAGRAAIASGNFVLSDDGGGWRVQASTPSVAARLLAAAPAAPAVEPTDALNGTISGARRYRIQGVLADGTATPASDFSAATAPTSGALKLVVSPTGGPQELRIWRYGTRSQAPDASIAVPAATIVQTLYDTGSAVNGFTWETGAAYPAPSG